MDAVQLDMFADDPQNHPKETKELLKLCMKVCNNIAKEVA